MGDNDRQLLKSLTWRMRRNPGDWSVRQTNAMHWLQRSTLKSARAWRLKIVLRAVYANANECPVHLALSGSCGSFAAIFFNCQCHQNQ